jgi:hypothetical protein
MTRTGRGIAVVAAASALVLALAACGTPPWEQSGATTGGATPSPTSTRIVVVHNDLQTGSTKRTLKAGDITLDVTYFSTLDIGQWYADANKPLSLTAVASLGTDVGQGVYLSKVTMTTTVRGPKGALPAPAAQVDQSTVPPGYFIKHPFGYSQTFVVPPVAPSATSATFSIVYELLLQTGASSSTYAKETASDSVTVTFPAR